MSAVPATGAALPGLGLFRRFATQEALLAIAVIGLALAVGFVNPRFLAYRNLADLSVFGVPMPVVIMVGATALAALWMRWSASGRAIYATGGNAEAARLCGVDPQRTVVMVFAIHGFFAGLATLVYATQLRVIQSTTPPGLELTVITAAVVGGVSILGGVGTVVGATLAAILIAEITSALVFVNVSPYWTDAVRGALILMTVIADIQRRRRRAERGRRV